MAFSTTNAFCRTWRLAALLALLLGGCSFDLGSWSLGPDKEAQPKPIAQQSPEITAQNISEAQSVAVHGRTLARSGKIGEALAEVEKALEDFGAAHGLTPQSAEPLIGRAISYLALDKVREAVADLDEAVLADPNSAAAWSNRGLAYEPLGDKTKAAASYSRAIAIRPRDDAARNGLARVGG